MLFRTGARSVFPIFLIFFFMASPALAVRAPEEEFLPPVDGAGAGTAAFSVTTGDGVSELEDIDDLPEGSAGSTLRRIMDESGSEAREERVNHDGQGRAHKRVRQYYKGLPVVGAEVIVHHGPNGKAERLDGKKLSRVTCGTTPALDGETTLRIGLDEHAGKPGLKVLKQPRLVILGNRLAYHYVLGHGGRDPGQWHYYVCAMSGSRLERFNNIRFVSNPLSGSKSRVYGETIAGEGGLPVNMQGWQETSGDFLLYSPARMYGICDYKVNDWVRHWTNDWTASDRAAVSAAHNLFLTQKWIKKELLLNSFDNNGQFALGYVHYGKDYVNAYWDGSDFYFGDGDGIQAGPLVSLDVVAHEFGHAVTQYTSDLVYSGDSGALNESYSDILGCAVEWAYQSPDPNGAPGFADWTMGEDVWLAGPALRDMRNPQVYGQPSYYKGTLWYSGTQDNGGVHTNSGVQNFAFYLLAYGGTGANEGHPYNIQGIGALEAARVAMRANMVYLTSTAGYVDSRKAWIKAASDLGYPVQTVRAAWDAVGVFDPMLR